MDISWGIRIDGDVGNVGNPVSMGNFIQGNTAVFNRGEDLLDGNLNFPLEGLGPLNCINTWTRNTFFTDNEVGGGAGPRAGCIR